MNTIRYDDQGAGFPIVWIHGFPLSSKVFEPQVSVAGFRHIRPDLPGFGGTEAQAGEASMATYARAVLDVMDDARVEKAVVAGLSMGGYIAMQLVRDAPERIAALLLLDTRETVDSDEGRAARYRQIAEVEAHGTAPVVEAMLPKMVLDGSKRGAVRAIMESASPRGVIAALGAIAARQDSTQTLRDFRAPALVVVGDRDELTPPSDAERMTSLIPHAELAPIANAAHLANYERPEQLNPLIAAFLMRHVIRHEHAETF